MAEEYIIKAGDTFYRLAQKLGGTWEDWKKANLGLDPGALQIGQKVLIPQTARSLQAAGSGDNRYAKVEFDGGEQFSGHNYDEIAMEVEGVRFSIRRVGEMSIPHELHLILPRTEIRKVQPVAGGPCEVQIMLSNVNIVHSPRIMSGEGNPSARIEEIQGEGRAENIGGRGNGDRGIDNSGRIPGNGGRGIENGRYGQD